MPIGEASLPVVGFYVPYFSLRGLRPPGPHQQVAFVAIKIIDLYDFPKQINHSGALQADLLEVSEGVQPPERNISSFHLLQLNQIGQTQP